MIDKLISPVSDLLGKFVADKDQRERLAHEIATMAERQAHEQALAQMDVNKQQATHKSLFVAGGRPAAVWVCVVAMAFNFVILPATVMGLAIADISVSELQPLDISEMMPVLLGLLGLGTMRSVDKRNKVAREQ